MDASHPREATTYEYDFTLSFAGEDRRVVEVVRDVLVAYDLKVFYDFDEQHELLGKDLAEHLAYVYQHGARFCVLFLSKAYVAKAWCRWERRAAIARALESEQEYVLPYYLEDCDVPSLLPTIGYVHQKSCSPREFGLLLVRKCFAKFSHEVASKGYVPQALIKHLEYRGTSPRAADATGFPLTYYEPLDSLLGLRPGDVCLIAGGPSMGKSALVLNVFERNAARGVSSVFVSENTTPDVAMKLLAMRANIPLVLFRVGMATEKQVMLLRAASLQLQKEPVHVLSPPYADFDELLCETWATLRNANGKLVVFDSLQSIGGSFFGSKHKVGDKSVLRALAWLAKKMEVVCLVTCGVRRKVEYRASKIPDLADVLGGKHVAALTKAALILYRPWWYQLSNERGHAYEPLEIFVHVENRKPRHVQLQLKADCTKVVEPDKFDSPADVDQEMPDE